MCLTISVGIENLDENQAMEIVENIKGEDLLPVSVFTPRKWFKKLQPFLQIAEEKNSCACSLLTEDADWDANTWSIIPKNLHLLANTITEIHKKSKSDITLEALWAGDKPIKEKKISIEEIVNLITDNKLGNKIKYRITKSIQLK